MGRVEIRKRRQLQRITLGSWTFRAHNKFHGVRHVICLVLKSKGEVRAKFGDEVANKLLSCRYHGLWIETQGWYKVAVREKRLDTWKVGEQSYTRLSELHVCVQSLEPCRLGSDNDRELASLKRPALEYGTSHSTDGGSKRLRFSYDVTAPRKCMNQESKMDDAETCSIHDVCVQPLEPCRSGSERYLAPSKRLALEDGCTNPRVETSVDASSISGGGIVVAPSIGKVGPSEDVGVSPVRTGVDYDVDGANTGPDGNRAHCRPVSTADLTGGSNGSSSEFVNESVNCE